MRKTVLAVVLFLTVQGFAAPASNDEQTIREEIQRQAAAWNKGDIPGFMETYENSPETTFIGAHLRKGYEPIRKRYQEAYTSQAQMGKLSFNAIEVRMLPSSCGQAEYALVTGTFHLDRKEKGESKKDDGIFSLVWHKGPHGWKIVLDHTS